MILLKILGSNTRHLEFMNQILDCGEVIYAKIKNEIEFQMSNRKMMTWFDLKEHSFSGFQRLGVL